MAPVVTGISASKQTPAPEEPEWSVDDLKSGKATMVYYYIAASADPKGADCTEDNFKFARKTEFSAFSNDAVERINKNWVAKKVEIDFDADKKLPKNQARVEFWSFTGVKMDTIAQKNQQILNPSDFQTRLKEMERKNRLICDAAIKRINDEIERAKKEETASAK